MAADRLQGCTVLVTRPAAQAGPLCRLIEADGGRALPVPAIEIEPVAESGNATRLLEEAEEFDAVIFASRNAVDHAAQLSPSLFRRLTGRPVFAVGPGTADALNRHGTAATAPPAEEASSEGLLRLPAFAPAAMSGRRVLIVRGEGGRGLMREELEARGARVEFAEVYRRMFPTDREALGHVWEGAPPDIIVVTSRQALDQVLAMTKAGHRKALLALPLVAISARVGEHATHHGFSAVTVAASADDQGLLQAILKCRERTQVSEEPKTPEPEKKPAKAVTPPPEKAPAQNAAQPAARRGPGTGLSVLALVLALAALAAAAASFLLRPAQEEDPRLAQLQRRMEEVNATVQALQRAEQAQEDRLQQQTRGMGQLLRSVESLQSRQRSGSTDWALAEVEHLLIVAMQRLALAQDVAAARAAVEAADDRLAGLDDPGLVDVRAQIMEDLNALRAVNDVDITGLSLFLADLAQRAEDLPLKDQYLIEQQKREEAETPAPAAGWRGVLSDMWREISDLVVISRDEGGGVAATLLPEERYFLVHNLRLQLEVMRLAVMRRDTATLRSSAEITSRWLNTYFDTGDGAVAGALEALRRMRELELKPKLPEIDSSLETLRAVMRQRAEGETQGQEEAAP